jgi:hypothetical protein
MEFELLQHMGLEDIKSSIWTTKLRGPKRQLHMSTILTNATHTLHSSKKHTNSIHFLLEVFSTWA